MEVYISVVELLHALVTLVLFAWYSHSMTTQIHVQVLVLDLKYLVLAQDEYFASTCIKKNSYVK